MIEKTSMQTVLSPALAAGVYTMTFGEFEKVTDAVVYFDNPFHAFIFHAVTTITGNNVAVLIDKEACPGAGAWVHAVSPGAPADMVGKKLTVLAKGE